MDEIVAIIPGDVVVARYVLTGQNRVVPVSAQEHVVRDPISDQIGGTVIADPVLPVETLDLVMSVSSGHEVVLIESVDLVVASVAADTIGFDRAGDNVISSL
jgi:hypothetical protein